MAGLDREALIGSLAAEFEKDKGLDVKIDKCNYIEDTQTLNCRALGLPMDVLEKTKNVSKMYLASMKEAARKDPSAAIKLPYIEVAIKCIDEIITLKAKDQK